MKVQVFLLEATRVQRIGEAMAWYISAIHFPTFRFNLALKGEDFHCTRAKRIGEAIRAIKETILTFEIK